MLTTAPATSSAATTARAAPPAPSTSACAPLTSPSAPMTASPSVLQPSRRPSRTSRVFTETARCATSSTSSQRSNTATLYGIVTFAADVEVAHRGLEPVRLDLERLVAPSRRPASAKAAFCIRGESEAATGFPSSLTIRSRQPPYPCAFA